MESRKEEKREGFFCKKLSSLWATVATLPPCRRRVLLPCVDAEPSRMDKGPRGPLLPRNPSFFLLPSPTAAIPSLFFSSRDNTEREGRARRCHLPLAAAALDAYVDNAHVQKVCATVLHLRHQAKDQEEPQRFGDKDAFFRWPPIFSDTDPSSTLSSSPASMSMSFASSSSTSLTTGACWDAAGLRPRVRLPRRRPPRAHQGRRARLPLHPARLFVPEPCSSLAASPR